MHAWIYWKKSRNLLKRMLSNLQVKYDLGPVCRGLDGGAGGERLLDADQPLAAAEEESLHPRQFAALQGRHHAPERPQVQLPPRGEPGGEPIQNVMIITYVANNSCNKSIYLVSISRRIWSQGTASLCSSLPPPPPPPPLLTRSRRSSNPADITLLWNVYEVKLKYLGCLGEILKKMCLNLMLIWFLPQHNQPFLPGGLRLRGVQGNDLGGGDAAALALRGALPPCQQLMADRGAQAHQIGVQLEDVCTATSPTLHSY